MYRGVSPFICLAGTANADVIPVATAGHLAAKLDLQLRFTPHIKLKEENGTMNNINESPSTIGKLISQTIAMPRETNANGDIFGGWLLSQMDLAGAILAGRIGQRASRHCGY